MRRLLSVRSKPSRRERVLRSGSINQLCMNYLGEGKEGSPAVLQIPLVLGA